MCRYDAEIILDQWKGGSRLISGSLEGTVSIIKEASTDQLSHGGVSLLPQESKIAVKVRGPPGASKLCFYFLEEILGLIDQVN